MSSPGPKDKPHAIASGKKGDLPYLQGAVKDARTIVEKTSEAIAESHHLMIAVDTARAEEAGKRPMDEADQAQSDKLAYEHGADPSEGGFNET